MNHAKQVKKIGKFIGLTVTDIKVKIMENNTVLIKAKFDGIKKEIHVAECHNKPDFRLFVLTRLIEMIR